MERLDFFKTINDSFFVYLVCVSEVQVHIQFSSVLNVFNACKEDSSSNFIIYIVYSFSVSHCYWLQPYFTEILYSLTTTAVAVLAALKEAAG